MIILMVGGGYWTWDRFFSSIGKERRFADEQMRTYEQKEKAYVAAMTADTYGGKTPKETLDLFVAALEKGDIDLASKYFLLDENLSHEKILNQLRDIKNKNLASVMVKDFKTAEPYKSLYENNQQFVIYNSGKTNSLILNMFLNKYSGLWKIERL